MNDAYECSYVEVLETLKYICFINLMFKIN